MAKWSCAADLWYNLVCAYVVQRAKLLHAANHRKWSSIIRSLMYVHSLMRSFSVHVNNSQLPRSLNDNIGFETVLLLR